MTTNRDFDRLARAWLDLLPDEAPDRSVAAVLQAVETTPQVRQSRRWLTWRSIAMNRAPLLIGAAAVVAVVGAGLYAARTGPSNGTQPASAKPSSATPAASIQSTRSPLPGAIQGLWMGDHRDGAEPEAGTSIRLTASSVTLAQSNMTTHPILSAEASTTGAGAFELGAGGFELGSTAGCVAGSTGTYDWTLSPMGRILTIQVARDDCVARAAGVAGVWWRMGCKIADDNCLGLLESGLYKSQFIAPRLDPGQPWSPNFGALSYRGSNTWANAADWPATFELVPIQDFNASPGMGEATRGIGVIAQVVATSQDTPCSSDPAAGVGRSVDALVAWLGTVPGLITTTPRDLTIDGHRAQSIDLRVDRATAPRCAGVSEPIVAYLQPEVAVAGDERHRLILVDLGDNDVVAIVLRTTSSAAFHDFVSEAMGIVESFEFE